MPEKNVYYDEFYKKTKEVEKANKIRTNIHKTMLLTYELGSTLMYSYEGLSGKLPPPISMVRKAAAINFAKTQLPPGSSIVMETEYHSYRLLGGIQVNEPIRIHFRYTLPEVLNQELNMGLPVFLPTNGVQKTYEVISSIRPGIGDSKHDFFAENMVIDQCLNNFQENICQGFTDKVELANKLNEYVNFSFFEAEKLPLGDDIAPLNPVSEEEAQKFQNEFDVLHPNEQELPLSEHPFLPVDYPTTPIITPTPNDSTPPVIGDVPENSENVEELIPIKGFSTFDLASKLEEEGEEDPEVVQVIRNYQNSMDKIMKHLIDLQHKLQSQRGIDPKKMMWRDQPRFQYKITSEELLKIKSLSMGSNVLDDDLSLCWWGILNASKALTNFFGVAVEKGYKANGIYNTMLLFGCFKHKMNELTPGDLVLISNAMSDVGTEWAIVVSVESGIVTEVLLAKDRFNNAFVSRKGYIGEITKAWSPVPQQLLDNQSPVGQFWGPSMSRLRLFLSRCNDQYDFYKYLSLGSSYLIDDYTSFFKTLGTELLRIDSKHPAWPGCVVLNDELNEIGIVLADSRIMGICGEKFARHPLNLFRPKYVWYPHL